MASTLSQPPAVLVSDSNGAPLWGVHVSFAPIAGGGSVNPADAVTDAGGIARTSVVPSVHAGPNILSAALHSSAQTATFTASVGAGAAAVLLTDQPSPLPIALFVTATDTQGRRTDAVLFRTLRH